MTGLGSSLASYAARQIQTQSLVAPALAIFSEQQRSTFANMGTLLAAHSAQQHQVPTLVAPAIAAISEQQRTLSARIAPALASYAAQQTDFTALVRPALAAFSAQQVGLSQMVAPTLAALAAQQMDFSSLVAPSIIALAHLGNDYSVKSKLDTLGKGFQTASGTSADSFGRLQAATFRDARLGAALSATIAATQERGTFGPNLTPLRDGVEHLASVLDADGADATLLDSLEEVKEVTRLDDEHLLSIGDALGWWDKVKAHRVTAAGLVLGYTVGLTFYVVEYGTGVPMPQSVLHALAAGGALYFAVSTRRPH